MRVIFSGRRLAKRYVVLTRTRGYVEGSSPDSAIFICQFVMARTYGNIMEISSQATNRSPLASLAAPVRGLKSQGIREEHPRGYFQREGSIPAKRVRHDVMPMSCPNHLEWPGHPLQMIGRV